MWVEFALTSFHKNLSSPPNEVLFSRASLWKVFFPWVILVETCQGFSKSRKKVLQENRYHHFRAFTRLSICDAFIIYQVVDFRNQINVLTTVGERNTWKSSLRWDKIQPLSSKADVVFNTKFGLLSFMTDWFSFSLASRHCNQIINTPAASRQNISIPADSVCLWPCDQSKAGCHVSDPPVWERVRPKKKKSCSPERERRGWRWRLVRWPASRPPRLEGAKYHRSECAAGENNIYSQNQGGDVRRAGAQIRYRLQFVVVQLPVQMEKKNKAKKGLVCHVWDWVGGWRCLSRKRATNAQLTYTSVSRCALEKTAPSSAWSLLWPRSLWKEREPKLYMAPKTKTNGWNRETSN